MVRARPLLQAPVFSPRCALVYPFPLQMWNYAISTLGSGCTVVVYDGSPLAPTSILFQLVDEHKITTLGVSPRYLQTLDTAGYEPNKHHDLKTLTSIATAGSVLKADLYDWVRDKIGKKVVSWLVLAIALKHSRRC